MVAVTEVKVSMTPALCPNNLSSHAGRVAFASAGKVAIVSGMGQQSVDSSSIAAKDGATVMQCKFADLGTGSGCIVVALSSGVQIWSADGSRMFLWAPLESLADALPEVIASGNEAHATGICSFVIGSVARVCVGTSIGAVAVYQHERTDSSFRKTATLEDNGEASCAAISDLAAASQGDGSVVVARGNIKGVVQIWATADGDSFTPTSTVRKEGAACNTLALAGGVLIVGFSDGEIRLYGMPLGQPLSAIAAHARWINALAVNAEATAFAAAAEDGCVSFWMLGAGGAVKHVGHVQTPDAHLVGLAFSQDGKSAVAAAYDIPTLFSMKVPS